MALPSRASPHHRLASRDPELAIRLAELIGTRRGSLTTALNVIERDDLIRIVGKQFILRDLEAMREASDA